MDANYTEQPIESRWNSYGSYRFIICAWMLNEISIVYASTEIAHSAFYVHSTVHALAIICIGIPLVYSEICIAQFTNCSVTQMWDFCPLLRSVGYGCIYLIILKTLYMLVITTWYLEYTFYAALDPPPWFNCDDFNTTKCMIKRINISVFQHCLEAYNIFNDDCGMKTASFYFYERIIGGNNTSISLSCVYQWKAFIAIISMSTVLFLLSLNREKYIQVAVKIVAIYVSVVMFVLFCVSLSTRGSWFSSAISIEWEGYNYHTSINTITRGFLSVGTGSGILVFLSRDVSFRSPATMTSVATCVVSGLVSLMFSLIAFSGIKTMSYFHGEEENVIEEGDSGLFLQFGSLSEILSYFDAVSIWAFAWFSMIGSCLFINFWILYLFLTETLIINNRFMRSYNKSYSLFLTIIMCLLALPFFCIDLNGSLIDATIIIQLFNSFFFAISLYWIYGYRKHSIDIIFMIGVKASYFWKFLWIINPIVLLGLIYFQFHSLESDEFDDSYVIEVAERFDSMPFDLIVFIFLLVIYFAIIVFGVCFEILMYLRFDDIRNILSPVKKWGPKDKVLFKSRQMFVPQIMTTEFLYRQVRIRGYGQKNKQTAKKRNTEKVSEETSLDTLEWSAFTSN